MVKNFYIIGHNPNTIEDVNKYLSNGANGIEPDICYHKDKPEKFYVHEDIEQIPDFIEDIFRSEYLSLTQYLNELKQLLFEKKYDLKIITFDLKPDYNYDINELYKIIRDNFSLDFPDVKIITTVSNPNGMEFLAKLNSTNPNEFVGVDEHAEPDEVNDFFKSKNLNHCFAAGSSVFSPGRDKFVERIQRALELRDNGDFKFVHAWCVNDEDDMKEYLDLEKPIDAILTDEPDKLVSLIKSNAYSDKFNLDF
ncbi:MAG: hypothetical protein JST55_13820 [Bacteroidetes bacterium]|nr:hypothetical protein [Bacteroidota bacterium]